MLDIAEKMENQTIKSFQQKAMLTQIKDQKKQKYIYMICQKKLRVGWKSMLTQTRDQKK